jgi:DHA1 family inner membrane transport protein
MQKKNRSLGWQVALFVLDRTGMNTAMRMVYPFLSVFAAGLGVSIETISLALFARAFIGVVAPLVAPMADRASRKVSMLLGTLVFTLGTLLPIFSPVFGLFVVSLMLMNLGVFIFLPAMQAYFGDRVPYERRGLVLGLTELSWSLSTILGVPIVAAVIASGGWRAPFPYLAGFGALMILLLALLVPNVPPAQRASGSLFASLGIVLRSPQALILLGMGLCFTFGNEVINLLFGVWLEDRFSLQIGALGAIAALIGIAELSGEGLSSWLADKMGKAVAIRIGVIGNILSALALVLLGQWQWGAILALFLFYLSFEFMLVSSLPLISEVIPQARATLMAANIMFFSLGRALGAVGAPWLYGVGFWVNVAVAVALNLVALWLLGRFKVK